MLCVSTSSVVLCCVGVLNCLCLCLWITSGYVGVLNCLVEQPPCYQQLRSLTVVCDLHVSTETGFLIIRYFYFPKSQFSEHPILVWRKCPNNKCTHPESTPNENVVKTWKVLQGPQNQPLLSSSIRDWNQNWERFHVSSSRPKMLPSENSFDVLVAAGNAPAADIWWYRKIRMSAPLLLKTFQYKHCISCTYFQQHSWAHILIHPDLIFRCFEEEANFAAQI